MGNSGASLCWNKTYSTTSPIVSNTSEDAASSVLNHFFPNMMHGRSPSVFPAPQPHYLSSGRVMSNSTVLAGAGFSSILLTEYDPPSSVLTGASSTVPTQDISPSAIRVEGSSPKVSFQDNSSSTMLAGGDSLSTVLAGVSPTSKIQLAKESVTQASPSNIAKASFVVTTGTKLNNTLGATDSTKFNPGSDAISPLPFTIFGGSPPKITSTGGSSSFTLNLKSAEELVVQTLLGEAVPNPEFVSAVPFTSAANDSTAISRGQRRKVPYFSEDSHESSNKRRCNGFFFNIKEDRNDAPPTISNKSKSIPRHSHNPSVSSKILSIRRIPAATSGREPSAKPRRKRSPIEGRGGVYIPIRKVNSKGKEISFPSAASPSRPPKLSTLRRTGRSSGHRAGGGSLVSNGSVTGCGSDSNKENTPPEFSARRRRVRTERKAEHDAKALDSSTAEDDRSTDNATTRVDHDRITLFTPSKDEPNAQYFLDENNQEIINSPPAAPDKMNVALRGPASPSRLKVVISPEENDRIVARIKRLHTPGRISSEGSGCSPSSGGHQRSPPVGLYTLGPHGSFRNEKRYGLVQLARHSI